MADDQDQGQPITVQVDGLGPVQFPAGTSQDVMKQAIDRQLAQKHVESGEAVPHPIVQRLLDWLPAVEAGAGGILGGVGGAALGGAAGEAQKQLGNRFAGNPAPATSAEAAKDIALSGAVQGGLQAIGPAITAVAKPAAERLMQSAVKPAISAMKDSIATGEAPKVVKTLLDEGINVTAGGVRKIQALIGQTNDAIKSAIAGSSATVDPGAVANATARSAGKFANQVNPTSDLKAVKDAADEFMAEWGKQPLSVQQAQDLKVGTYKALGDKAYTGELKGASIEAQKDLARGLKEGIEQGVPGVKDLNAREGRLINAAEVVGRRVAMANNRDLGGLSPLAAKGAGLITMLLDRSPAVKSLLARGLYNHAAIVAGISPNVLRLALASVGTDDGGSQ